MYQVQYMLDRISLYVVIIAVILTISQTGSFSAQNDAILQWKPVTGAGGYIIEIRDSGEKIIVEKMITDTTYDISKLKPGKYQYRLTTLNKLQRKGNNTGWINFSIEKGIVPVLTKVSKKTLSHSTDNLSLTVTGENFLKDTRLYLKKGSEKIELDTSLISSRKLKVIFSLENKTGGVYDLVAVNRGGFESVMISAIEITDPLVATVKNNQKVETDQRADQKNDVSSNRLARLNMLTFGAGWDFNIPVGEWSSRLKPSLSGFHLYLSYPLSNIMYAKNIPFLKNCGAETSIGFADYKFVRGLNAESFKKMAWYAGLNYPLMPGFIPSGMSLIFNLNGGAAYSSMTYYSDDKLIDYSSIDFSMKAGVTIRYEWFNNYFTDLSFDYSRLVYMAHPLDEAKISFRAGVML